MLNDATVDFYASESHYLDHLAPVYLALPIERRGLFYAPSQIAEHAKTYGVKTVGDNLRTGDRVTVVASYNDLRTVRIKNGLRRIVLTEHGCGLMAGAGHTSYAGGSGYRSSVSMFLCPNDYVKTANERKYPNIPAVVVGCPKLDKPIQKQRNENPVIAIGFHWDCRLYPETQTAFHYYKKSLAELAKKYHVIGHAHPRIYKLLAPVFQTMGITPVEKFEDVLAVADVYVNDCSSTMYEAAYYDTPVVVLNTPTYRRGVNLGIRFWDFADVGVNCDAPEQLISAVQSALEDVPEQKRKRLAAVSAVYPVRNAAENAARELLALAGREDLERVTQIDGKTVGIIYTAFGDNARNEIIKSVRSLYKTGYDYPITVIGDGAIDGLDFIRWDGQSPFDMGERKKFKFRAGRVKPELYDLSPYDYTLYIDADTQYKKSILVGFESLRENDVAVAVEPLSITELYNKPLAGWEVNIQERDATVAEIGATKATKFINSGVLFFRKSDQTKKLFSEWARQWERYKQWDEQLAFMRAAHKVNPKIKLLSVDWNNPHDVDGAVIFHNYGRGSARL